MEYVREFCFCHDDQGVNMLLNMFFGPAVNAPGRLPYRYRVL